MKSAWHVNRIRLLYVSASHWSEDDNDQRTTYHQTAIVQDIDRIDAPNGLIKGCDNGTRDYRLH